MNIIKKSLLCICTILLASLVAEDVVIIGGGPAGLATAIEAHQSGAHVTIIEKRNGYTRNQGVFLRDHSLALLEKWKVKVEYMAETGPGLQMAIVPLKALEEGLEKRVNELGIQKLHAEFKRLVKNAVVVQIEDEERIILYDFLVGADGAHSCVRESLDIGTTYMGSAIGAGAFVSFKEGLGTMSISPDTKQGNIYGKRVALPDASIVFVQTSSGSLEKFEKIARDFGWQTEADAIVQGQAVVIENVEIIMQQAEAFSDATRSAILVGDAAATASFFRGLGANTAFKAAAIAGNFFREVKVHPVSAYDSFNQAMREITDVMIDRSRSLF